MKTFFPIEVKKIDLSEDQWVKVYTSFSVERAALFRKGTKDGDDAYCVLACVSSWNLKDAEGKEVECTIDNIRRLENVIATKIVTETITSLKPESKESKKKES